MSAIGMGGSLVKGSSNEWWTPPHIFGALSIDFDLDPCAPPGGIPWVPAERSYSIMDDGLSQPWEGKVWLNPPYGREASKWVGRLIEHGNGIALVFVRSDAKWAQEAMRRSWAVCFIAKRLSFVAGTEQPRKGHSAANSSMLLAFGEECAEAVRNCGLGVSYGVPLAPSTLELAA